jgi:RNA-directed DNA polymerase
LDKPTDVLFLEVVSISSNTHLNDFCELQKMYGFRLNERTPSLLLHKNCEELKNEFLSLETKKDVARLLDVSYDQLIYHLYKVPEDKKYKEFSILKKAGSPRIISAPISALKILQRKLSQVLYAVYEPKATVHGFLPGRSITTNAKQHVRKRYVLNIDLKDFFDSVHFGRVRGIFMAPPYNRPEEVSTMLAKICCHSGKLPQGAPSSPIISNMICARMDSQLRVLASNFKCTYTRYADDITISTTLSNFPKEIVYINYQEGRSETVLGENLMQILRGNSFEINENKVRLQHKSHRQEVTGLTVNQFVNVKRSYIKEISSMLQAWDKFGLESVETRYTEKCSKLFGDKRKEIPPFLEVLRGKIHFLGMVRGKNSEIYRKYLNWYYQILNR